MAPNKGTVNLRRQSVARSAQKGANAFLTKPSANRRGIERIENIGNKGDEEAEVESLVEDLKYTVDKLRQQFTLTTFRFRNRADHIFIALSLVASLNNILRFPILCYEGGGVLFFIPYVLCLIFITAPIIYLENALGQYSSLPPVQLFYHLCPAFGGIGLAMSLVAIFKSLLLSYSALDLFYTLKSITAVFSSWSRTNWLTCVYNNHPSCYDPYVKCDEATGNYQYYSKCYNLSLWGGKVNPDYTWEQVVIGMTSTSAALRELPPYIYLVEKIRKPGNPSAFFVASATLEQAIIAVIGMLGMRVYAKISRFIVIFPFFCFLACMVFILATAGIRNSFAAIAEGFSPDPSKFFSTSAWASAILHAVVATNLLDGSFITIATMKDFKNNFMRDTAVVINFGILISISACFVVYAACGAAAQLIYPLVNGERLPLLWLNGDSTRFIIPPIIFAKTPVGSLILSLVYFSAFLSGIGAQVIALEMIIMTVYRTAERMKYLDPTASRNIIVCLYFLCMYLYAYLHSLTAVHSGRLRYFYFAFVLAILALFEVLVSIHIYRLKRFVVNLGTMLGSPPSGMWRLLGYPVNWYLTFCWYVITPALCLGGGILALYSAINNHLYSEISAATALVAVITLFPLGIIVVIMIIHIVRAHRAGIPLKSLFKADLRWVPELGSDRQQALYDERATRVVMF